MDGAWSLCYGAAIFWATLGALAFAYHFVLKLPAGLLRVVFLLPVLPIFFLVPWSVPLYHLRALLSFVFLWTGPSKLLLLCWDAGVDYPPSSPSFLYFLALFLFPIRVRGITPKQPPNIHAPHGLSPLLQFLSLIALLNLYPLKPRLPIWFVHLLYTLYIYLGLDLILGGLARLVHASFGVESDPQFDNPLMSASLSEFWGRRWNLVVTTILRSTVYNPALLLLSRAKKHKLVPAAPDSNNNDNNIPHEESRDEFHAAANPTANHSSNNLPHEESSEVFQATANPAMERPSLMARAVALLATFLVSGLIHELIFYYINKSRATGEVTAFFILHGFATAMEVFVRRSFPSQVRVPRAISIILTMTFLYTTAAWLFMPALSRAGADTQIIAEYHQLQTAVLNLFMR